MAFPTTSQLTDFTGSLESPISEGGTWASTSGSLIGGSDGRRDGSGNLDGGAANFEMRRTETVGPQLEVWGTLSAVGTFIHLWFLSGGDYYRVDIDSGGVWRFYKTGDVQIGANLATQAMSAGDAMGFEYIGGTLRAYRKPSGGSWGQIGTDRSDSLLASSTGNLAVSADGTTEFTDFGGGTVASASTNLMPQIWM